jgi:hypothetical protein
MEKSVLYLADLEHETLCTEGRLSYPLTFA